MKTAIPFLTFSMLISVQLTGAAPGGFRGLVAEEKPEEKTEADSNPKTCGTTPALRQSDYRGFIGVTTSGKTCQAWDAQEPHEHTNTPDKKPGFGLEDGAYCRNSDGSERAWCYTTDPEVRWDYCDVPECGDSCGSTDEKQIDYRGTIAFTKSGKQCQAWAAQEPHSHKLAPEEKSGYGLEGGHNYCRNPDESEEGAWCYTTDPNVRWEYCDVPNCTKDDEPKAEKQTSHTDYGKACPSTKDSDCSDDLICGRKTASRLDEKNYICCEGKTRGKQNVSGLYHINDYCDNLEEGEECLSDSMCKSDNCSYGKCLTPKKKGEYCSSSLDSDCEGDLICGRKTAGEADQYQYICCKGGTWIEFGGLLGFDPKDYCYDMEDGSTCWSDAMCKSGQCSGNNSGLQKGTCITPKAAGESCETTRDSDCAGDLMCARKTASDDDEENYICCDGGTFGSNDFCYNMPDGSSCWSDAMCESGQCSGNNGGGNRGTCISPKEEGESCPTTRDSDCTGDLMCARKTASDDDADTYICCDGGTYGSNDFCYNMPDGSACWSDAMCDSGLCSGNMGGFQRGTCTRTKGEGDSCPSQSNSECTGDLGCYRTSHYGDYECCSEQNYCDTWNPGCTTGYWYCSYSGLGR